MHILWIPLCIALIFHWCNGGDSTVKECVSNEKKNTFCNGSVVHFLTSKVCNGKIYSPIFGQPPRTRFLSLTNFNDSRHDIVKCCKTPCGTSDLAEYCEEEPKDICALIKEMNHYFSPENFK